MVEIARDHVQTQRCLAPCSTTFGVSAFVSTGYGERCGLFGRGTPHHQCHRSFRFFCGRTLQTQFHTKPHLVSLYLLLQRLIRIQFPYRTVAQTHAGTRIYYSCLAGAERPGKVFISVRNSMIIFNQLCHFYEELH